MKTRYGRNIEALLPSEVEALHTKRVCVVGCGGLGGHIAETLARIGVLNITAVDCDIFEESNLNRQLFSSENVIGTAKAEAAKKRIGEVNSDVYVEAVNERLSEANAERILAGHDLAMDALDNAHSRAVLMDVCDKLAIPIVHGGIAGWYGQVSTVYPGDFTLREVFTEAAESGLEKRLGNPPFTASVVAALQCAEAVKILSGRGAGLRNSMLRADLLCNDFSIVRLV